MTSNFKNLKKKREEFQAHNRTSGNNPRIFIYENEFNIIAKADDSVEPEFLCGIGKTVKRPCEASEEGEKKQKTTDEETEKKKTNLVTLLREMNEKKEEQRERRHKEKMDLLAKLIQLNSK